MPRYVILEHDHPFPHFDFMLESGEVLWTWRLLVVPAAAAPIAAEFIFDHRLAYLDYEGPVSGNRGRVKRWDWGEFTWIDDEPGRAIVRLSGKRLQGNVKLEKVGEGPTWTLDFTPAVEG